MVHDGIDPAFISLLGEGKGGGICRRWMPFDAWVCLMGTPGEYFVRTVDDAKVMVYGGCN